MKFELNKYHRNIPDDVLLQDMRRVAGLLGKPILSRTEYAKHGQYSHSVIEKRFNGWSDACKIIGLSSVNNRPLSTDEIVKDLVRVAQLLGKPTVTTGDYAMYGNYDRTTIIKKFKTWNHALHLAELEKSSNANISNEELLIEIERIWTKLGRQPTSTDIKNGISLYSLNTYSRRFGGWRGALETFIEHINTNDGIPTENNDLQICEYIYTNCDNGYSHKTKREPNLRLRFRVLKRDNFKCCACGASPSKKPSVELHIDHLIPWSKGGETILENLQTLCQNCNYGKGDLFL